MAITPVSRGVEKPNQTTPKLSVSKFAERYGVSTMTIYRLLWDEKIPGAVRVRNQWRIPANALEN